MIANLYFVTRIPLVDGAQAVLCRALPRVAIGWWMVIIAAPFVALAPVGWTFEYFRGQNAV